MVLFYRCGNRGRAPRDLLHPSLLRHVRLEKVALQAGLTLRTCVVIKPLQLKEAVEFRISDKGAALWGEGRFSKILQTLGDCPLCPVPCASRGMFPPAIFGRDPRSPACWSHEKPGPHNSGASLWHCRTCGSSMKFLRQLRLWPLVPVEEGDSLLGYKESSCQQSPGTCSRLGQSRSSFPGGEGGIPARSVLPARGLRVSGPSPCPLLPARLLSAAPSPCTASCAACQSAGHQISSL